jgi:hypothetical protein
MTRLYWFLSIVVSLGWSARVIVLAVASYSADQYMTFFQQVQVLRWQYINDSEARRWYESERDAQVFSGPLLFQGGEGNNMSGWITTDVDENHVWAVERYARTI